MEIASAQLPAIHASDDKIVTFPKGVIMLDGASAFVSMPVPPAIYAAELGAQLSAHLVDSPGADLAEVLGEAILDVAARLDLRPGKSPSSTVTIVREYGGWLDLLLLGDNLVVLPKTVITDMRLSQLDLEPSRRYRQRLGRGLGFDAAHRNILRELQTQQAERRNRPGGYWIAEAEPAAARNAVVHRFRTTEIPWVGLATDGAYKPMQHLHLDDWPQLASVGPGVLEQILRRCEDWEARDDPAGVNLPRAKRHDDKSIAIAMPTAHLQIADAITP
ncbi:hypothetical protein M8542_36515 [Amycolatopsis sp. OK19-0408]|uniref:Protein phosphatase 2C-like protein n=1 Tax=Amycolatopsis iheyensis TaxID=2945988 RepID=A0A9X2SN49_9PSEU|nr:hypothetical protein [Amycolatopsis iheyensis]MCR6488349.1 hypothetical protein [Amycolatopsis iheyensis]